MSSEPPKSAEPPAEETEPTASKDLTDGLHLMLSAAKKALKNVDPNRIEEVGRRALKNLENVDSKKVRKAAKNLDPRKIEEVAEEAGRELLSVMERVAERVERIASGAIAGAREGAREGGKASSPPPAEDQGEEPAAKSEEPAAKSEEPAGTKPGDDKPKVRVGD